MAKKYIVQNNSVTEVIYIGGCQSAKGGQKRAIEPKEIIPNAYETDKKLEKTLLQMETSKQGAPIHGLYHDKNYRAREKKRKATIQELIINNFEPRNSCMLTLTFNAENQDHTSYELQDFAADDVDQELMAMLDCLNAEVFSQHYAPEKSTDVVKIHDPNALQATQLSDCNKRFKQFIQRIKYHYPLFKYVAVVARQESGNWHYHLVCNMNFIPFDELHRLWGNGAVYFRAVKKDGLVGLWKAIRYLQKNLKTAHFDLKNENGYLASKGLERDQVFRSWVSAEDAALKLMEKTLKGITPDFSYQTMHEYTGVDKDKVFEKELTATCKYFKYFKDNASLFPKLPNAYRAAEI